MSFETVERLKRDYTDKWVTVDTATPELRRFVGLSGQIKTVNMNGRALVQFDNPVDISWYDIDLAYLKVINAPAPKKTAEHGEKKAAPAAAAAKPAAPAAKPAAGGKSPIEIMREAAAAKAAAAGKAAPPPAAPAAGDKPLSKIEQARLQGAAKAKAAAEATVVAAAAAPAVPAAPAPVPVSSTPLTPPPPAPRPEPVDPAPVPPTAAPMVGEDGKPLSKLEMARRQGAVKKQ